MAPLTAGIDIGTTSVKAVAVDEDGTIVARARIPHRLVFPAPDRMEHDAAQAWRRGPLRALAALGDLQPTAVAVASMVPSFTAVDRRGYPIGPGLLYGDARGRTASADSPAASGEAVEFLRWSAANAPGAHAYWPAPAVASFALAGEAVVDYGVAFTSSPLFGPHGWDEEICAGCGVRGAQLPRVAASGAPIGRIGGTDGPLLATGGVDAMVEQIVAGADHDGDVLVLCGTTLMSWAVLAEHREAPGLWTIPHTTPGRFLIGGPSNAGGLFLGWVERMLGRPARGAERLDPANVPVWAPYPRGERAPLHDPDRRATLDRLDVTHGPAAVRRAAWEASGFVVRHQLDLARIVPMRIVATGGGTKVDGWMQALADATQLPVHVAAVPEGAAQGAAYLARMAGGSETDMHGAARWARTARVVEPDAVWARHASERYARFRELTSAPSP